MTTMTTARAASQYVARARFERAAREGTHTRETRRTQLARTHALSRTERVLLVLLAIALVACALASRGIAPADVPTTHVRVAPGDTLWSIAAQNAAPGLTTAQTADLIAKLNDLESSTLVAGAEIDVPRGPGSDRGNFASR